MNREEEKIKEIFQDAFESFEAPVEPTAWSGIESGMNAGAGGTAAGGSSVASWVSSNLAWVVGGVVAISTAVVLTVASIGSEPEPVKEQQPVQKEVIEDEPQEQTRKDEPESGESNERETAGEATPESPVQPEEKVVERKSENTVGEGENSNTQEGTAQPVESSRSAETEPTETGTQLTDSQSTESTNSEEARQNETSQTQEAFEVEGSDDKAEVELVSGFQIDRSEWDVFHVRFSAAESEADSYLWEFGDGQTETTEEPVVEHEYSSFGDYEVKLKAIRGGAEKTSSKSIEIFEEPVLALPNVISPNGDGVNDYFDIIDSDSKHIADYEIKVFTDENELIFQSHGEEKVWNGNLPNGSPAPAGKYVVVVNAIGTDGKALKPRQESLTLKR